MLRTAIVTAPNCHQGEPTSTPRTDCGSGTTIVSAIATIRASKTTGAQPPWASVGQNFRQSVAKSHQAIQKITGLSTRAVHASRTVSRTSVVTRSQTCSKSSMLAGLPLSLRILTQLRYCAAQPLSIRIRRNRGRTYPIAQWYLQCC